MDREKQLDLDADIGSDSEFRYEKPEELVEEVKAEEGKYVDPMQKAYEFLEQERKMREEVEVEDMKREKELIEFHRNYIKNLVKNQAKKQEEEKKEKKKKGEKSSRKESTDSQNKQKKEQSLDEEHHTEEEIGLHRGRIMNYNESILKEYALDKEGMERIFGDRLKKLKEKYYKEEKKEEVESEHSDSKESPEEEYKISVQKQRYLIKKQIKNLLIATEHIPKDDTSKSPSSPSAISSSPKMSPKLHIKPRGLRSRLQSMDDHKSETKIQAFKLELHSIPESSGSNTIITKRMKTQSRI